MKTIIERKGFKWDFCIVGIVFLLLALFVFAMPEIPLYTIAMIFGVVAMLNGIWLIQNRHGRLSTLAIGILEILIGAILLANLKATANVIPYLFAIWFILNSAFSLLLLDYYKKMNKDYYWFALISSVIGIVLGIVLGVVLLLHPLISMLALSFLIGMNFLLAGIVCMIVAFSRSDWKISIDDGNDTDLNDAPENPAAKRLRKDDIETDHSRQDA